VAEGSECDVRNSYAALESENSLAKQGMGIRADCTKLVLAAWLGLEVGWDRRPCTPYGPYIYPCAQLLTVTSYDKACM
jgi:hypothetical protein